MRLQNIDIPCIKIQGIGLSPIGSLDKHLSKSPSSLPSWVIESMEFWYDVEKQGATNESLSANPYLTDFSGKGRPLKLMNFAFSGMSGDGVLPEYPNALVTDGVNDYGVVQNMDYGVSIVFLVLQEFATAAGQCFYDQRATTSVHDFAVIKTAADIGIAYNSYSSGGRTYINGSLNTSLYPNDSIISYNKKIVCHSNGNVYATKKRNIHLLNNISHSNPFKGAFYSAIGFNRVLTQEEIDWVIENIINTEGIDFNLIPRE